MLRMTKSGKFSSLLFLGHVGESRVWIMYRLLFNLYLKHCIYPHNVSSDIGREAVHEKVTYHGPYYSGTTGPIQTTWTWLWISQRFTQSHLSFLLFTRSLSLWLTISVMNIAYIFIFYTRKYNVNALDPSEQEMRFQV